MANTDQILVLIETLSSEDDEIAESAAEALADIGDPAVPPLIGALNNNNANLRANAVAALGMIGEAAKDAVPVLINMLDDEDKSVRYNAVGVLALMGEASWTAIPILINMLEDEELKEQVAGALIHIGEPAVPSLIEALNNIELISISLGNDDDGDDGDDDNASSFGLDGIDININSDGLLILFVLEQIGTPEALEVVKEHRREEEDNIQYEIEDIPDLIEALRSEDVDDDYFDRSHKAHLALVDIGETAVPALMEALKDENDLLRTEAYLILDEIGEPAVPVISLLIRALDDEYGGVTDEACDKLVEMGNSIVPSLTKTLSSESWNIRRSLLDILERIDTPEAIEAISQYNRGEIKIGESDLPPSYHELIGVTETRSETTVISKDNISELIEALSSYDGDTVEHAAKALGQIGKEAKEAIPNLINALQYDYIYNRNNIIKALGNIGEKIAVPILVEILNKPPYYVGDDIEVILAAEALFKIDKTKVDIIASALRSLLNDPDFEDTETEHASYILKQIEALEESTHSSIDNNHTEVEESEIYETHEAHEDLLTNDDERETNRKKEEHKEPQKLSLWARISARFKG